MQAAWFVTLFVFSIIFFLVFFVIYFFRPRKDDKIVPESLVMPESSDPEDIIPRSPRAEPNWPARALTENGENLAVNIANISRGSAFVSCTNPLPVGDTFQLTIDIPERQPIKVKAEVIWSNGHLPESKVLKRGMGIRLIGADIDDIQFIDNTIKNHPVLSDPSIGTDQEDKDPAA
jgi:Tfp pilus assembly protein PilZ